MPDIPGGMTTTAVCPACGSEHIEELPTAGELGTPDYRCLDCGTEFNASGAEPPLTDSDDPHAAERAILLRLSNG